MGFEFILQGLDHILMVRKDHHRLIGLEQVIDEFTGRLDFAHSGLAHDFGQTLKGQQRKRLGWDRGLGISSPRAGVDTRYIRLVVGMAT